MEFNTTVHKTLLCVMTNNNFKQPGVFQGLELCMYDTIYRASDLAPGRLITRHIPLNIPGSRHKRIEPISQRQPTLHPSRSQSAAILVTGPSYGLT